MASEKALLLETIQKYVGESNWKAAIPEMEKLFALDPDPIIRVRIGDAYLKLGSKSGAVKEYVRAGDLYAQGGSVVKALAQYKLALRFDPSYLPAQEKLVALHSNKTIKENKVEPAEARKQKPTSSVIPLFAGFTSEEFDAFTKMMVVHTLTPGTVIVRQHETGKSVYVIANGSVKVYTTLLSGDRVELAVLQPSDFFGEISFLTGKPRTATVETAEDTVILEVTEDKLRELVMQRPRVKDVLQKYSDMRQKGTIDKVVGTSTEE